MSKPATKTVRYYILSAIGIAIMLFFRFLPPMGTVTELGMNVLGIFLGAMVLLHGRHLLARAAGSGALRHVRPV